MLGMTTPIVTELPLRMEAVTADTFLASVPDPRPRDRVMNYVECDLAAELTLPQRRRARASASTHSRGLRRRFAPLHRPVLAA
jgi:hypothetical protein